MLATLTEQRVNDIEIPLIWRFHAVSDGQFHQQLQDGICNFSWKFHALFLPV